MKTNKLLLGALSAVLLMSWSCARLENFKIDSPSDLDEKISQYKEEQAAMDALPDGAVEVDIDTKLAKIGEEDLSSAWWKDFGQYYTIPVGKKLVLRFNNYSLGEGNWQNWCLCVTTPDERGGDNYSEYFLLRSDKWGWRDGNGALNIADLIDLDMDGVAPDSDAWWETFRQKMNGSLVQISIDHASEGKVYIVAESTAADGTVITEKLEYPVSDRYDINAFLVVDHSRIEMRKAYMMDSEYPIIPDANPKSIMVTGFPEVIEKGASLEAVLAASTLVAKVTFEDGTEKEVDPANVKFSVAEDFAQELGMDVIMYTYDRTRKDFDGAPVITGLTKVTIAGVIASLEANATAYLMHDAKYVTLSPENVTLKAIFTDETESMVASSAYEVIISDEQLVREAIVGTYSNAFTVKYGDREVSGTLTIANSMQEGQNPTRLGKEDFSSVWFIDGEGYQTITKNWSVAPGESMTVGMTLHSQATENFFAPSVVLRHGDSDVEYCVVRMDHFGWGDSYAAASASSNWNWGDNYAYYRQYLNESHIDITIANNGAGKACIRYNVVYANNETHFQYYDGIAVNADENIQFAIATQNAYLDFEEVAEDPNPLVSISASAKASVVGSARNVTLSPENIVVEATYKDNTTEKVASGFTVAYTDDKVVYPATAGTYQDAFTVTYKGKSVKGNLVISASTQGGQNPTRLGKEDFSSVWFIDGEGYQTITKNWSVAPGESMTVGMTLHSQATENFFAPSVVLRHGDSDVEYCVVRMDHFGWGDSYAAASASSNWNWGDNYAYYRQYLNESHIDITIANNGAGKASIRYFVVYSNNETHYQYYDGIPVNVNESVQFAVATQNAYLDFD